MDPIQTQLHETDARLMVHEAVCAERYQGIQDSLEKGVKRMQKIEYLLYGVIAAVLLGPNFTAELLKKFIGL
jgi:predicted nucleic acid-binding Zn ribbon protein